MFYIHGGGFNDGSSKPYGPDFFLANGVILVTINYRLGPFGFLSMEDITLPGNNGLKDQHLALQWVQSNINFFGGDSKRVTIFGHSAGSASVGYHLLNSNSKDLFWNAICQSGSFLGPWAYQRKSKKAALMLASYLNYTFTNNNSSEDLLEFLQSVKAKDIRRAAQMYNDYIFSGRSEDIPSLEGLTWAPTLEVEHKDAFITEKMYQLAKKGKFLRVPLLIGFVTEENLNFHLDLEEVKKTMKMYDEDVTYLVPVDMNIADIFYRKKLGNFLKNMYTNGTSFSDRLGSGIRFSSDNDMTRPIMKQAEFFSKYTETYFYVFSYDGPFGVYTASYDGADTVGHGEELFYLFCLKYYCDINNYSKSDQTTQQRLLKIWTDFTKFGNPIPKPSMLLQNLSWPKLEVKEDLYLYVDIDINITIKNYPKKETYKKWNELYNNLQDTDFITW